MQNKFKKLGIFLLVLVAIILGTTNNPVKDGVKLGFSNGFSTLSSSVENDLTYDFAVTDMPATRAGAASSSTGFEFGRFQQTAATAFTTASTSNGFAITMKGSGRVKACAFNINAIPTTGTVSMQIQVNGTLATGKYCKLGDFASVGGGYSTSRTEAIGASDILFVTGDRLGIIASTSNLSAATVDGWVNLIIQLDN